MRAIDLAGFERTFGRSDDPWDTFASRDEADKRARILHAMGPGPWGRVLELASGNGSNSAAIALRARRLDATEGTPKGTQLTAQAIAGHPRARAVLLELPGRFPSVTYDIILIAELLYYLAPRDMAAVALDCAAALRPGGRLVLAHHRISFHDFAQHAGGIHDRFLAATGRDWRAGPISRTDRWLVQGLTLPR